MIKRNRLITYSATGSPLPKDSYGNSFSKQLYTYDCLNNITSLTTTLEDESINVTTFCFSNSKDPTQLTSLSHTHELYPKEILLRYDSNGYMIEDEEGRSLFYDPLGRLIGLSKSGEHSIQGSYYYDATDKVIQKRITKGKSYSLYYNDEEVVNQFISSDDSSPETSRLIKMGRESLAVSLNDELALTASSQSKSLLYSLKEGENQGNFYLFSPYGNGEVPESLPAFNGELKDPISHSYHLGNGYRSYSPKLMRFTTPDSFSPFSFGGINPYSYCLGDPINRIDPSGHLSTEAWTGIGMGIAGISISILTGGSSILATGGIYAAISSASSLALVTGISSLVSDASAIASNSLEESNPEASQALGWVALTTGALSLFSSLISARKVISKLYKNFKPRSKFTTYGYDLKSVVSPRHGGDNGDYFMFSDKTHKKSGTRLTILGHGQLQEDGNYKLRFITDQGESKYVSPEYFSDLKHTDHTRIKLIMCNSATGGENSFAAKLARITEKPVKGSEGTVTAAVHYKILFEEVKNEFPHHISNRQASFIVGRDFEEIGKYPMAKNPYEIKVFWCFKKTIVPNYKPRRFNALGQIVSKENWKG